MQNPNIDLKARDLDEEAVQVIRENWLIEYFTSRLEMDQLAIIDDYVGCCDELDGVDVDSWLTEVCTDTVFKDDYTNPLNAKELMTGYVEYLIGDES